MSKLLCFDKDKKKIMLLYQIEEESDIHIL